VPEIDKRASRMRRHLTPQELKLWNWLRKGIDGARFRKQIVVGDFIVDFVAPKEKLVVEVDGISHEYRWSREIYRDAHLSQLGYGVLHLSTDLIESDFEKCKELVQSALDDVRTGNVTPKKLQPFQRF
jgi:very-short-patch-repair endonuclease